MTAFHQDIKKGMQGNIQAYPNLNLIVLQIQKLY